MLIEIYCIKDNKAGFFLKPFDTRGPTDAIRSIKEVAQDPKTTLNKNPEDYTLYLIGKMDDETGIITTEDMSDPSKMPSWTAPHKIIDIKNLIEKGA